jgi:hypothetical protein
VGRVMSVLGLDLSLNWCISAVFDYVSHQAPRPTEMETPIPVQVSGVKPDLDRCPYQAIHVSYCFI